MKAIIIVLSIFSLVFSDTLAQSGCTDRHGGHWNRKTGTYHYHNKEESSNFGLYTILGGGAGVFFLSRSSNEKK